MRRGGGGSHSFRLSEALVYACTDGRIICTHIIMYICMYMYVYYVCMYKCMYVLCMHVMYLLEGVV